MNSHKRCKTCGRTKEGDQFYKDMQMRDGLRSSCKRCDADRARAWQKMHPNRHRRNKRTWQQSAAGQESARRYRVRRAAYHTARHRRWRELNQIHDRERKRISSAGRRARKRGQFIEDVDPQIVYAMHGGRCGICGEFIQGDFHVDHVIPLVKGGMHGYVNVQPAHPRCNLRKGVQMPHDIVGERL